MKAIVILFAFTITSVAQAAGSGREQLTAALADLQAQRNYHWTRTMTSLAKGESESRLPPEGVEVAETVGWTDNVAGLTSWNTRTSGLAELDVKGLNFGQRVVVSAGEGWFSLEEMQRKVTSSTEAAKVSPDRSRRGEGRDPVKMETARRDIVLFFAGRRGVVTPRAMLEAIGDELGEVLDHGTFFSVEINPAGARRVLDLTKGSVLAVYVVGERGFGASVSARFWTSGEHLEKMEILVHGQVKPAPSRFPSKMDPIPLDQSYVFTFDKFGLSDPRVFPEALEKLGVATSSRP